MHNPQHLTFTADLDSLELALPEAVSLDEDARTIEGTIVPFNIDARRTSYGKPVRFTPGCLIVPKDLSRVKLLEDHDHGRPVGYALSLDQNDTHARARFQVPPGAAGDQALAAARDHLRDGLSVGVDIRRGNLSEDGNTYIVSEAVINEVSLCSIPAFEDARVTRVTASQQQPTDPADDPDEPDEDDVDDQDTDPDDVDPDEDTQEETNMPKPKTPAGQFNQAPAFHGTKTGSKITLSAAFDAIAAAVQTASSASEVQAALTDILPAADVGKGLLTEAQIGELWQARGAETPYVDFAYTRKQLTSGLKMMGWAWNARPSVGDYTGNKTEIPSSTASTKPIEASVARMAGGWDVDRIYVDLADGAMLNELVNMAIQDYGDKINAKARAGLLAAATTVTTNDLDLSGVLTSVGAASTEIGARIDYLAMAADVWSDFAGLTALEVPWWLRTTEGINIGQSQGNVGNVKLWVDPDLTAGTWVAGDKRAANWWDKNPPIRVQAVDLPRGGVDVAVFGYYASVVSETRAVWTGTTAPAVP